MLQSAWEFLTALCCEPSATRDDEIVIEKGYFLDILVSVLLCLLQFYLFYVVTKIISCLRDESTRSTARLLSGKRLTQKIKNDGMPKQDDM